MPGSSEELTLYSYFRSSASYRVRLALAAKKLPYRMVTVNILAAEQSEPAHLARNPSGYVPALVVGEATFYESVAICELLDELHPDPPLYPTGPFDRARVRALCEIVNAGIQPLQNLNVLLKLPGDHTVRNEWIQHFIAKGLGALERAIEGNESRGVRGKFAYGDSLTAADLFVVPQLYNARRYNVDLAPYARVVRADASALALPGLAAAAPENQPDFPKPS